MIGLIKLETGHFIVMASGPLDPFSGPQQVCLYNIIIIPCPDLIISPLCWLLAPVMHPIGLASGLVVVWYNAATAA